MAYTLVQLIQQACGELALTQPSAVISSSNNQTKQFLALAQRLGKDLVRDHDWQQLVKVKVFQGTDSVALAGTTTSDSTSVTGISSTASLSVGMVVSGTGITNYTEIASVDSGTAITLTMPATASGSPTLTFKAQDYALPSDYDRMVPDTHWDRVNLWRAHGARSSQHWQWLVSGGISPTTDVQWRLFQNKMRLAPPPTASTQVFAYEYVSNFWVIATGGTSASKAAFTADTDTSIFQDDLMLAGIKYYFLKAKKLDFAVEMAEFNEALSVRKSQDVPQTTTSLGGMTHEYPTHIPEGSWDL